MSICINNDLIWISIPRCGSVSIENALLKSNIPTSLFNTIAGDDENRHMHYPVDYLYEHYGRLETLCITRDWFDRWLSALKYFWTMLQNFNLTPIIEWKDMDNNFIYENFNKSFADIIYSNPNSKNYEKKFISFLKNNNNNYNDEYVHRTIGVFCSEKYFKCNEKCTYEFDIKEMYKFEEFIQKKYNNTEFKVPHINCSNNIQSKIIINDELKNFVWDIFESRFEKKKNLI